MINVLPRSWTHLSGLLLVAVCSSAANMQAETEFPILNETFEVEEQLADNFKPDNKTNWRVEEGIFLAERGGTANCLIELEPNCVVELDVAFEPASEAQDGFSGIRIGGDKASLFVIKSNGFWRLHCEQGDERAQGLLVKRDIESGRLYHFRITRIAVDGGYSFLWEVDGEMIGEFTQMKPPDGEDPRKFALFAWRAKAQYDNVVIHRPEPGTNSGR